MKISAIIPTYQSERYIGETLSSIANQTRTPDEVIISDDCSSDRTQEIIENFSRQSEFPIHFFRHDPPQGITRNYLNACSKASGDIIIIGDHDDVWVANKTEIIEDCFKRSHSTVLLSSDSTFVDHKLAPLGYTLRGNTERSIAISKEINEGDYFSRFLRGGLPLLAHTLSFRASINEHVLNKPEHISSWWFEEWLSSVATCCGRLSFVPESLTLYRQHQSQTTKKTSNTVQATNQGSQIAASRSDKMHYCLGLIHTLISSQDANTSVLLKKQKLLETYIEFLKYRDSLKTSAKDKALKELLTNIYRGHYGKFSSGITSVGMDTLRILGIR